MDDGGATETRTGYVTLTTGGSGTPIADLLATNDSPTELGRATPLAATTSTGSNVSYDWAFGDGGTGNGAVMLHTYPAGDTYTAVVTASNSFSSITATTTVTIVAPQVITYTYDGLHRLTGATYSTGESYAYAYDAVGNRVAMTDTTGTTTYTYDDANRLTRAAERSSALPDASVQTYTWDDRGNLIHDGAFIYTYSAAGWMVRAESLTATLPEPSPVLRRVKPSRVFPATLISSHAMIAAQFTHGYPRDHRSYHCDCSVCRRAYSPPAAISSSWLPSSTMRPPEKTTIRSHSAAMLMRWVTMMTVRSRAISM